MSGKVYLVGAGPGAADLITLRGADVLRRADIVFHDALVHPDTLALAPRARKEAVGKRCGRHSTAQRFINRRLVEATRRHAVVVRLKGGDPMLFGRAHEEIAALAQAGIEVEVVPGVTAALAASADLQCSLTQREVSRSVVFATPREAPGSRQSGWARAVAAADTAVLYMAAGEARSVVAALAAAGMAGSRPAVLEENASHGNCRVIPTRLRDLPAAAAKLGQGPALVMLGDVYAALAAAQGEPALRRTA